MADLEEMKSDDGDLDFLRAFMLSRNYASSGQILNFLNDESTIYVTLTDTEQLLDAL